MRLAELAVLLCLQSFRMVLLFFCHVVITLLAFRTCQCDFYAHDFHLHCVFTLSLAAFSQALRRPLPCPAVRCSYITVFRHKKKTFFHVALLFYHTIRALSTFFALLFPYLGFKKCFYLQKAVKNTLRFLLHFFVRG